MRLTLPRSDHHNQVQITLVHPDWVTTSNLDDSHLTVDLEIPEGSDINDIEVLAHFVGVDGKPDPRVEPVLMKGRVAHAEQTNDAGQSDQPHSDEPVSNLEHPEDSHAADAGVEGDADAGRVGEAEVEQNTGTEPAAGEPETVTPESHHKPRRPKHA